MMANASSLSVSITPNGRLRVRPGEEERDPLPAAVGARIAGAFEKGPGAGLLQLGTGELQTALPPTLAYLRDVARDYLTRLCHVPGLEGASAVEAIAPPEVEELGFLVLRAPPMTGLEYLNADVLGRWWTELDEFVRGEIAAFAGGAAAYLREKNPLWRLVGRVTFHLAENKRDEANPFAFMATYASRLSALGRLHHLPLSRALQEYAGAKNKAALVSLLTPIQRAGDRVEWVGKLIETGGVYQALAWSPREAHAFLRDLPALEESGLVVRVPDWWRAKRPPRPQVSVKVGDAAKSKVGVDALMDFKVGVALEDQQLTEAELAELLSSAGGLVRLRGQWVEVDREKLAAALEHWKRVEREAGRGEISFFEGMRLLAGAGIGDGPVEAPPTVREWTGIAPGRWLADTLEELNSADAADPTPKDLKADLRPYQATGVHWLRFMTRLGLGACLADDMGLGKTVQVLALLLHERQRQQKSADPAPPSLLVVPASLIGNWQAEIARFAPSLTPFVAHPSETDVDFQSAKALDAALIGVDVVITTYAMLTRLSALRERHWRLAILDEAQAIKNSGARQTKSVKELQAGGRIALTGTPIENRLSDLWSLFDFLNPGLLGNDKAFSKFAKGLQKQEHADFAPLRALVKPYILRRLKTDKRVIADLPDKTEMKAFCGLSKRQAMFYEQSVRELSDQIARAEGIQRRGIVLAYLMRLKQICNHPSHWTGDGGYDPSDSGKFQRLGELCTELAERQEKTLIFTQFREVTAPIADFLQQIYGRAGLVLHGSTPIPQRREMVKDFQRDDGPPFFVLSLKAGGTGLNLTAASQVIHFDRWWNPAVENQATDRAFRIGQKRNVMVHKFVCRGTVEEKIDQLITDKIAMSQELLGDAKEGAEKLLTEMTDQELMRFVSLDLNKATEA